MSDNPPAEPDLVAELRRGYAAFNSGDFDSAAKYFAPDIELIPAGGQPPIKGAEAIRAWMEPDAFEWQVFEALDFTAVGNRILVRLDIRARGSGSGIELEFVMWAVWTAGADGRWVRVEVFQSHEEAEARRAAGLTE